MSSFTAAPIPKHATYAGAETASLKDGTHGPCKYGLELNHFVHNL